MAVYFGHCLACDDAGQCLVWNKRSWPMVTKTVYLEHQDPEGMECGMILVY